MGGKSIGSVKVAFSRYMRSSNIIRFGQVLLESKSSVLGLDSRYSRDSLIGNSEDLQSQQHLLMNLEDGRTWRLQLA